MWKGEWIKTLAANQIIRDCVLNCSFVGVVVRMNMLADAVSAVFGEPCSVEDLQRITVRIINQERLFNVRDGFTRKEDTLPARLLIEPKPDSPKKGTVVPLDALLDDFYRAMGWDIGTGIPTDTTLEELKIEK